MSLATLLNIPDFNNLRSVTEWSFSNQAQHLAIVQQSFVKFNQQLTLYPLDPFPVGNVSGWLQLHQQAHNDMASVLNIENFDLSSVDFRKPDELTAWARLHFDMHQQAAQILGLN
jgi:hypothetical protein